MSADHGCLEAAVEGGSEVAAEIITTVRQIKSAADVAREAVDLVLIDLVANADTAIVVLKSGE